MTIRRLTFSRCARVLARLAYHEQRTIRRGPQPCTSGRPHIGELGGVGSYLYWSKRLVQEILDANEIMPGRRVAWSVSTPGELFGVSLPQLHIGPGTHTPYRHEIARRIETAIGQEAVTDFVTPPQARFAKGVGRVNFAEFAGPRSPFTGAIMHVSTSSSDGRQVDLILFGSQHNLAGRVGVSDPTPSGWSSSAMFAITEFLASRGTVNRSQWDDPEALSYEAWKLAYEQGNNRQSQAQPNDPWMRGFTLGHDTDAEWVAQIYSDVIMDKSRWDLGPEVDRILIGAPLWIRSARPDTYTRYHDIRRRSGGRISRP